MIVCPWCGTNFAVFQSNCSRCGGPIQAPKFAVPAREEVDMPPPPPREISKKYLWNLMLSDAWAQAAFVFALLGAIFSVVGFALTIGIVTAFVGLPFLGMGLLFLGGGGYTLYWRYQESIKAVNILQNGEAVVGQITGAEVNYSVRVNGQNPLTISYQFAVAGKKYENKIITLNRFDMLFQTGKEVCVLYLPEQPDYNSLYPHP
jgi:hypothetical protein